MPKKPPPEVVGFQDLVRAYDEEFWYPNHPKGAATIKHLYYHLIPSITMALPNGCPHEPRFAAIWADTVPCYLLENAARLANQFDAHVMIYVCRDNLDVIGEINWGKNQRHNFPISLLSNIAKHDCRHDIELLLRDLERLGILCEYLDNGNELGPNSERCASVVPAITGMMQFAYHLMPMGRREPNPKIPHAQEKTLEGYLLPLRMRIDVLRERMTKEVAKPKRPRKRAKR